MSSKKVNSSEKERESQERKEKQFINELLGIKYQTNIDLIQKAKMINDKINEKRKDLHKLKHKLLERDIIGDSKNNLPLIELGKFKLKNTKNLVLSTNTNSYNSNRGTGYSNINFKKLKISKLTASNNTSLAPSLMTSVYVGEMEKEINKDTINSYSNKETIQSYSMKENYYHGHVNCSQVGSKIVPVAVPNLSLPYQNSYSNLNMTPYLKNLQEKINIKRALFRKVYTRSIAFSNECIYSQNSMINNKIDNTNNNCNCISCLKLNNQNPIVLSQINNDILNNTPLIYDNHIIHHNLLNNKILNPNSNNKILGQVSQFDNNSITSNKNNHSTNQNYISKKTLSTIYTNGGSNENTNYNNLPKEYYRGRIKASNRNNYKAEPILIQNSSVNGYTTNNDLQNRIKSNLSKILNKEILAAGRNKVSRSVFASKSKSPRGFDSLNHSHSESYKSVNSLINNIQNSFMNTKSTLNVNCNGHNILSNPNILSSRSSRSKTNRKIINNAHLPSQLKKERILNSLKFDILSRTPSGANTPGDNVNNIKSKINVNLNQGKVSGLFPNIQRVIEGV